jgi:hypothetical protein
MPPPHLMSTAPGGWPFPEDTPEATYSRLVPGTFAPFDEVKLKELALRMRDSDAKRKARGRPRRTPVMKSGYVYLGQFVDHDLTCEKTLVADAQPDVAAMRNHRTPRFDLDSLYGKDPAAVPFLYDAEGCFRLGSAVSAGGATPGAPESDLYRDASGNPCIVDPRNDENLVVAQLHVLFAKLHNRVLRLLERRPELAPGHSEPNLFSQAKRLVTWLYQWIIVEEFLPSFVRRSVLDEVWRGNLRLFARKFTPADAPMALPIEFTTAAFRFGHSAVQENYGLNDRVSVDTSMLIFLTKKGGGIGVAPRSSPGLPTKFVVDWDFYFSDTEPRVNRGQNIDTFITETLYELPPQTVALFRSDADEITGGLSRPHLSLPELTLLRGSRTQLPSGEEFARHFGYPVISARDIPALEEDRAFFSDPAFRGRTPLWYYLLREAPLAPEYGAAVNDRTRVQKLGPIGSQIIAEVFYQALACDADSILNAGNRWRPPEFIFGGSAAPRSLGSMAAVVEFVRDGERAALPEGVAAEHVV